MLQRADGVVLRTRDYGESHQIVLIFTEYQGKIAMMAKGSKKTKSRFGASLQPLTQAQFVFYRGTGMGTLSQADIIASHQAIRADLMLTSFAAYWFELVDRLIEEKEPHPQLYRFLLQGLSLLEGGKDPQILTRIFELNILRTAGLQPVLDQCVYCDRKQELCGFSFKLGGLLCEQCLSQDNNYVAISSSVARMLSILNRVRFDQLGDVQLKKETQDHLEHVIDFFMKEHLSISFKTKHFLKQMTENV